MVKIAISGKMCSGNSTLTNKIIEHEKFQRGCLENPMTKDDIEKKFLDNSTMVFNRDTSERLLDSIMELDNSENLNALLELVKF